MMNCRCVVVRAYGRQADLLRAEAHRISRDARVDWSAERRDLGIAFCFEALKREPHSAQFAPGTIFNISLKTKEAA